MGTNKPPEKFTDIVASLQRNNEKAEQQRKKLEEQLEKAEQQRVRLDEKIDKIMKDRDRDAQLLEEMHRNRLSASVEGSQMRPGSANMP